MSSHFRANEVPTGECHAVDAFVRIGQTIEVYRRREVDRETLKVEAVSLVKAYVWVRIFALTAATWERQESLESMMRPKMRADGLG